MKKDERRKNCVLNSQLDLEFRYEKEEMQVKRQGNVYELGSELGLGCRRGKDAGE